MKPVILAEKPSQAKAYADAFSVTKKDGYFEVKPCSIFPEGAYITWGIGHLIELRDPKSHDAKWTRWSLNTLPILPDQFLFQIGKGKAKQFGIVKKLLHDTDLVINACDADREGSNIFYSILHYARAGNKQVKRLWINSLEVDEVKKGFAQLQDNINDLRLYEEAKTRQMSDWLVGMNGSRLFTLLLKQKGIAEVFSVGRVQSPTLFLIYERHKEIEQFEPKPFYELEAQFTAQNGTYKGKVKGRFDQREEAEALLIKHQIERNSPGIVANIKQTEKKLLPPKLHALSTLQATANKKWKMSPAKTLETLQKLYEKKWISYPRTDTQVITKSEFDYIATRIEAYQQVANVSFPVENKYPQKRYVNDAAVKEHYAIVPTKTIPTEAKLQQLPLDERRLYEEIVKTTLGMFHRPYRYMETKVETMVNGLSFWTTGKQELDAGWKEMFPTSTKSDDETLPKLTKDEDVQSEIELKEGITTPPKPYTEGELIPLMKSCGKKLENAEDVEILQEVEGLGTEATRSNIIETLKKQSYIRVQKNSVSITEKGIVLCSALEGNLLASPEMTAKWESYLNKIGRGEGTSAHFMEQMKSYIHHLLQEAPKQLEAKTFVWSGESSMPNKRGGPKETVAKCPACQSGNIIKHAKFYGCSGYKEGCKFTLPAVLLKKRLTNSQIRDLCEKGQTGQLKGFTSKNGKSFSAALRLVNGKIELDFSKQPSNAK